VRTRWTFRSTSRSSAKGTDDLGTRPAILVDTNIIIETVRVGAWERLRAHESVVTVRQCCEEALSGVPGAPGRVPVTAEQLGPPLTAVEVTNAERAALLVTTEAAATLDEGERDLLAHARMRFASGNKDFVIVCADQAAIKAAITLGLNDALISLEEALKAAGIKADGSLKEHYTRRRLDEWKTKHALGI